MFWKPATKHTSNGKCVETCRGLRPRQVIEQFALELGRALLLSISSQQAEEARRGYGSKADGPIRSRGVTGVMPSDSAKAGTRRGWPSDERIRAANAVH